jgi:hypothetical protein
MHDDITPTWLDRIAVARCLTGHPVGRPLHHAERLAVTRELLDRGERTGVVARHLACNADTARRIIREATT